MGRVLNGNAIYSMPSIIYKKAACQLHFELTGSLSHIDFMFLAFLDHLHKFRPDGVLGPADAPVGKDTGAFSIRIDPDQVGVILHLVFKAAFLFLLLGADPAVSRHPEPFPRFWFCRKGFAGISRTCLRLPISFSILHSPYMTT